MLCVKELSALVIVAVVLPIVVILLLDKLNELALGIVGKVTSTVPLALPPAYTWLKLQLHVLVYEPLLS